MKTRNHVKNAGKRHYSSLAYATTELLFLAMQVRTRGSRVPVAPVRHLSSEEYQAAKITEAMEKLRR